MMPRDEATPHCGRRGCIDASGEIGRAQGVSQGAITRPGAPFAPVSV
jgi:hypothetical protein